MTYKEVFPIWWSMAWRGLIVGTIAGFIAGGFAGFLAALAERHELAGLWGGVAGWIVGIPVSIWAMRNAINKHMLRPAPPNL